MPTDISRERVEQLVAEGALLVDVRPEGEFGEEHIVGAINIPLKTLDATSAAALDRSRTLIVY